MLLTLFGGSPPVPATSHSSWGTSWGTSWGASWGYTGQPVESSARSGYWRLEYYKLQEKSLKKRKDSTRIAPEATRIKVRYLKDRPPEPTKVVTPELPPRRVPRPLLPSTVPRHGLTIFDIVKQQELTAEPYRATMNLPLAQRPQRVLVDDQAANDEALLLLLSA